MTWTPIDTDANPDIEMWTFDASPGDGIVDFVQGDSDNNGYDDTRLWNTDGDAYFERSAGDIVGAEDNLFNDFTYTDEDGTDDGVATPAYDNSYAIVGGTPTGGTGNLAVDTLMADHNRSMVNIWLGDDNDGVDWDGDRLDADGSYRG